MKKYGQNIYVMTQFWLTDQPVRRKPFRHTQFSDEFFLLIQMSSHSKYCSVHSKIPTKKWTDGHWMSLWKLD